MDEKEQLITRLRRIEGQVRGLIRMVEAEEPCDQTLTQLLAARAALDQAGLRLISSHLEHCMPDQATSEEIRTARRNMQRILELLLRMR